MAEPLETDTGDSTVDATATAAADTAAPPAGGEGQAASSQTQGTPSGDNAQGAPDFGGILDGLTGGDQWDPRSAYDALNGQVGTLTERQDRVLRETGQIGAVQRAQAEQQARLDAYEQRLQSMYETYISSPMLDEAGRAGMQARWQNVPQPQAAAPAATGLPGAAESPAGQPQADPAWQTASSSIRAYADAKGFDANAVPSAVWDRITREGVSPAGAERLARQMIDQATAAAQNRQRVATETTSAPGSPSPQGGAMTVEQFTKLSPEDAALLPDEEYDRLDALVMSQAGYS